MHQACSVALEGTRNANILSVSMGQNGAKFQVTGFTGTTLQYIIYEVNVILLQVENDVEGYRSRFEGGFGFFITDSDALIYLYC